MFQDETIARRILQGEELRLVAYDETGAGIDTLRKVISRFSWTNFFRSPHPDKRYDFIKLHIDALMDEQKTSSAAKLKELVAILSASLLQFTIDAKGR